MPRNSKIKSHNFDSVTRANLFNKRRDLRKNIKNATKSEKLMNGIAIWCSFYRMFPHVFVKDYFGITLKPFQKILIYFMMTMNHYIYIASRGR